MIMSSEQLTSNIIESFCKQHDLNYEKGTKSFFLWEHSTMMSSVTLRECLSLATVLNARYYLSSCSDKGLCFVLYNIGAVNIPF